MITTETTSTLDVVIWVGGFALIAGFFLILWNYIKGLTGSPRELYMLYIAKLLEYGAYGAINYTFVLYLSADCGLSDLAAGTYVGIWSMAMTVCSMLVGAVCDAIGIKRTLLLGTVILLLARVTMPFIDNPYIVTFTSFLPMAVGMGMLLPVLSVGIKYYTTTEGSVLGFALFYTLMNVGWALGAWIFDAVRRQFGEHEIVEVGDTGLTFSTYQIIFIVGFLLTVPQIIIYLLFRRGVRMTDDRGVVIHERKAATDAEGRPLGILGVVGKAARDTVGIFAQVITKKPFWIFIFMLAMLVPVRLVFYHFHYTWPKYGIRLFGEGAPVGNVYGVLNPLLIVYLAPLMAVLTKKARSYTMLTIGTLISVGSVGIAILPPEWFAPLTDTWVGELVYDRWLGVAPEDQNPLYFALIFFIIVFTFGEAIWSPRLMQFTADIAPGGKEGTYIALSYLPYFGAKLVVGPMSGWLVTEYTPEGAASYPNHHMVWVWIGGMAAITPIMLITMYKLFRHAEEQDVEHVTEHE
jgi:dipeptide/tripeptide permease